jgi:glycosyltransferase involved in cell wall biosynthesis
MKIVRIIARLNIGGPAIHVVLLTHGFQERGHESHLLVGPVPEIEGNMEYYASERHVSFTRIQGLVRPISPWKDLKSLCEIYRFIRRERPDVVHTHTAKAGTLGRVAAILAGTPAIFHTFHGSVFDGYFSPVKTRLFLFIERLLARFTDRVITVGESLRNQLSEVYKIAPLEKIEVVRLGFDLQEFCKVAEDRHRWSGKQPVSPLVIGWVGRFTEIKDPLFFIDLASALKSSGISARFMMAGDGSLRSVIEARISERGLTSDFLLTGWRHKMVEVYSGMDLIVSTSINEGTPVTIIEAMATGCPFVAPNVGGLTDLTMGTPRAGKDFTLYSNGILVPRRDIQAFVRAVSSIASDLQLRQNMGRAGYQFAAANFGQDRLIRDLESLYSKFLRSAADTAAKRTSLSISKE